MSIEHKQNKDHIFTVTELSNYIKSIVSNNKIIVTGEISQPKLSGGHLYFSLKDESSNIKSIIWKSKNINKDTIIEGYKITLGCRLDYYYGTGNVNLIVDNIITNDGHGEMFLEYERIKQDFINRGYFDNLHKKPIPKIIKNILIITSENGAALQDFIYNLNNNNSNINYDIEDVVVQGVECPNNICELLKSLRKKDAYYDLVVITRGGGSFSDLFGFSQPRLIKSVYNFHLPVLSAIGHQVDNPLIDLVADVSTPTPSLAAQFIVDHNKKYLHNLNQVKVNFRNELLDKINNQQKLLSRLNERLYQTFKLFNKLKYDCQDNIKKQINDQIIKLSIMESKVTNKNNSINLYHNNTIINSPEELTFINGIIKLRWQEKEFTIKIIKE
jgi:exodeoxyribonuclease VII large subunit